MSSKRYSYLITPSILDGFRWFKECPPSWRDRAFKSLMATIRREPWTPSKAASRGIDFEQRVYAKAYSINNEGSELFRAVVDRVKGGQFQQVIKENIEVQGLNVLLYGKVDVLFPNEILDIKTTERFDGPDKYLKGWQHLIYTKITGLNKFNYIIALFEPHPSNMIIDVMEVPFVLEDTLGNDFTIKAGIEKFFAWLNEENLFYDYEQIYSNNGRR